MCIDIYIYEMSLVSVPLSENAPFGMLFGIPNYNIANDLDGSTEPTLYINRPELFPDTYGSIM